MKGLVVKNTGSWYTVLTDDGQLLDCKIKGRFRLQGIRSTNPVAVGDKVVVKPTPNPSPREGSLNRKSNQLPSPGEGLGVGLITEIEDRRNYIIRKSQNLSKQSHILAANVDQALLIVTVSHPETSTTFIDRFLASAEAYRVPVVLVFNKTDLLTPDELRLQQMIVTLYETIGYECLQVSAKTGEGLDKLTPLLQGKITLLSGNSGVGKSTLINRLVPGVNLRTAEISDAWEKGMHTTTFSEMIPIEHSPLTIEHSGDGQPMVNGQRSMVNGQRSMVNGQRSMVNEKRGWLIDTPGVKGFGTFDMEREELTSYFREIYHYSQGCRFSNCTHTHEPGCAVLKALDDHLIAASRYQSYISMLDDKEEGKYR